MRLVCPNCEAKYEVPDDAIPDTGRDVQCANCGHAWFQMRPRPAAASSPVPAPEVAAQPDAVPEAEDVDPDKTRPPRNLAADAVVEAPAPDAPATSVNEPEAVVAEAPEASLASAEPTSIDDTQISEAAAEEPATLVVAAAPLGDQATADTPIAEPDAEAPVEPDTEVSPVAAESGEEKPEPAPAEVATETEEASDESANPPAQPVPYAVDDSVLAILREEAEREANARRNESQAIETQTELGVDAAVAATLAAAAAEDVDGKPSARRDLFPDVEEINSTLRPSEHQDEVAGAADMAPTVAEGRRGFRSGFLTVMIIAILGAAVYVAAPMLSSAVPSLAAPLDGYVAFVDSFRLQLDGLMRSATASLNAE